MSFSLWLLGVFSSSFAAGTLGALVGVGGGIVIIPALTLLWGVDIRQAVAASLIAVVASSNSASVGNLRRDLANVKLAMLLEPATVSGSMAGAMLAGYLPKSSLQLLFSVLLLYVFIVLLRKGKESPEEWGVYEIRRKALGVLLSGFAGLLSGLLGVGGGVVKVPLMSLLMGVPLRVAAATSNLIIGVTASASAMVYLLRGDTIALIAVPVALGTLLGARLGARFLSRISSARIKSIFLAIVFVLLVQMLYRSFFL
jgi:uncharacterized membrane protein YfcA